MIDEKTLHDMIKILEIRSNGFKINVIPNPLYDQKGTGILMVHPDDYEMIKERLNK